MLCCPAFPAPGTTTGTTGCRAAASPPSLHQPSLQSTALKPIPPSWDPLKCRRLHQRERQVVRHFLKHQIFKVSSGEIPTKTTIAQLRDGRRGRKEDAGSASPESATESHSCFSSYRLLPKKRGRSPERQNLPFPNSTAPHCPFSPARPRAPGQMTWPTCKLSVCWASPRLISRHVSSRRVPAGFTASPLTSYSKASVIHSSASPSLEY